MSNKKYPYITTPRAVAAYTWLNKPDQAFNKVEYKITLVIDKEDMSSAKINRSSEVVTGKEFIAHVLDICNQHGVSDKPGTRGCPIKDGDKWVDNKTGEPREWTIGKWIIQLKSKFKPKLVDTKGTELPSSVQVLNGDIVRAVVVPSYGEFGQNQFVTLYLNQVCLVDKRVEAPTNANFYDEEGGFEVSTADIDASKVPEVEHLEEVDADF